MPFKSTSECVMADKDRCKIYAGAFAAFPRYNCRECCLQRFSSLAYATDTRTHMSGQIGNNILEDG
jgi:hypothetical protein